MSVEHMINCVIVLDRLHDMWTWSKNLWWRQRMVFSSFGKFILMSNAKSQIRLLKLIL